MSPGDVDLPPALQQSRAFFPFY